MTAAPAADNGVYKWFLYATDGSGERQSRVGRQTLTVK
jgi:hypothetical protein